MGEGGRTDSDDQSTRDDTLALDSENYQEPVSPILRYKERADFATLGEILETWTQQFPLDQEDEDEDPAEDGTLCTGPAKMWCPPLVVRPGWCRLRLNTTSSEAHTLVQYRELLRQVMTRVPQYRMCSELALRELVKNVELFAVASGAVICKPPPKKQQRPSVHGRQSRHSIRPSVLGDSRLGDSGASSFDEEEELEVAHLLLNGTALVFPNGFRIPETLPNRWYTKVALSTNRDGASPRYANLDANILTAWGLRRRNRGGTVTGTAAFSRSLQLSRPLTSSSLPMQGLKVQPAGVSSCSRLHGQSPPPKRQNKQRRGISHVGRPEVSPNDCLPGVRTVPPYRVLDPVSPDEGGNVTICALENTIVAVIPRAFLHSSELEKEADKVERRRQRYALNQATLNGQQQQQKPRKSHQFAMASTIKQVLKEAVRKTAAQAAHEKVQNSQEILKKKLLASTLQSTVCAADPGAVLHLPETPEDVQDLFPSLTVAQAEKVFEELAPENAKVWRAAQDRKKEDSAKTSFGKSPSSWARLQQGFRRASSMLQAAAIQAQDGVVLNTETAEFEKIKEHWSSVREEMGLSPAIEASKVCQRDSANSEKLAYTAEYADAKASEGIWKSEPIFLKALDAGEIGTQSAVDGSLQEFLSHVPAFASLRENHAPDGRSWEQVYNMFTVKRVPEGTSLLEEGELTDRIIGIMSGEVEVSSTIQFRESSCRPRNILIREKQTDVGDANVTFRILGPGDFLGHFRPTAQPYRSLITARARTACRVCRSSAASVCARVFMHLLDGGGQMMESLHEAATGWMPNQPELRKIMIQQRQWAAFKDRTVQEVVADPINRTAQTAFQRAPGAQAWLQGGEADAYRGDVPTINLADGGPACIRGGRPTSATLARQLKDVRSTTSLVPYASRLRDKSPANGADLATRRCGHCPMVRNQAAMDHSTRPCSAPGGLKRSASEPGRPCSAASAASKNASGMSIAPPLESLKRKSKAES
eukprot:gnl/MRDRNA2_/MRDRNA2_59447_c0_seq1.p1 gnl/MRDRNA2_/MRDRNA2_59447_c0~~gnl/MRDRNA2_/MRDRNA2_59447_c0_seq1.p1  ORF type:complete len:989 (+),score=173.22 gnl/MRDRNA2_/MRDRNA2_59447_c0_seq1:156-3122(+)